MRKTTLALAAVCLLAATASAGSPAEWRSRTIYQLLTDRFNNPSGGGCTLSTYCGGTFQGVIDKLDYIVGMGFDAIWISPIPVNTPNGYHGYWAQDITKVNPNFGTADDLTAMIKACHAKNVWVMLDVVGNHFGYGDVSSFVPFNSQSDYHDCNGCDSNCDISDFNNQPQVQHCRLAGLPDLNQTNPSVAAALNSWVQTTVQTYGFDGIRVDTVPEVNKPFWQSFNKAAGVFAVGEVDNGDTQYVAGYQGSALDATLSYPLYFTLRNVFASKQSMNQLQSQFQAYNKLFSDPTLLGTFIDNHDNPRFLSQSGDQAAYKAGIAYVLYSVGIPIIYYGTEQAFSGGNDPANREALWPAGWSTSSDLYSYIKTLVAFRKTAKLWESDQVQRYSDDSFYAFTRGDTFVAVTNVGSSGSPQQRTITYHPYANGTKLCNLFYPTTDCFTVTSGSFDVYLEKGETKIYSPTLSQ